VVLKNDLVCNKKQMKFKGKFNKKFPPKKVKAEDKEEEYKPTVKQITPLPDGVKSILSVNGYSLPKAGLPAVILSMIRRDLVITPHVERPEYGTIGSAQTPASLRCTSK
jgi:hypothetical protein